MGILREITEELKPYRIEDNLDDYALDDSTDGDDTGPESVVSQTESNSAPTTPRRRRDKKTGRKLGLQRDSSLRKCLGQRKMRRLEHARMLGALVEEDVCEDLSDLLPDYGSAFARLLSEKDSMEKWNAFVSATEEEQTAILMGESFESVPSGHQLGGHGLGRLDARSAHPAFAGEARFARVDSRFRHLLNHKHTPHGKLDYLEESLVDFFSEDPHGVWLEQLESSYDRLLTHAVSQWLGLKSLSMSLEECRETQVENPLSFFIPPQDPLSTFLTHKHNS